jgi:hypothetical protein
VENRAAVVNHAAALTRSRGRLRKFVSLLALLSLFYLLGAAVMFFELPTSTFLRRGFAGGVAWYEGTSSVQPPAPQLPPLKVGQTYVSDKACDGFTLCMYGGDSRAMLINMRGDVVHEWHVPFSQLWPAPDHVRGPVNDAGVYFNDAHLYPNGDLVVVIEGPIDTRNSSNGYGLAKLDKDSRVLWKYARHCHHDVAVDDDGFIYAIVNEVVHTLPAGLEYIPTPCMIDVIDVISPEGKLVKKLPLVEALKDSPYAALFCMLERPSSISIPAGATVTPFVDDARRRDVLHTNCVKVLSRALAPKFPMFKAGQIMLSLRQLDALAVVDPQNGKVVWAARGPWRAQHDPSFLDNGRLLLFDNLGAPSGSRVLEYDPQTQALPWVYPGEGRAPFLSRIRGMSQRLPNGNTLIVNSVGGTVFEVTPDRDLVWSSTCGVELYRARRFTPEQVPFVKETQRARS